MAPKRVYDFEFILQQKVGGFGRWQRLQFLILSFLLCLIWAMNLSFPFLAYNVPYSCWKNGSNASCCLESGCKCLFHENGFMRYSTVSEWLLICSDSGARAHIQMSFFVGFGIGILLTNTISKRIGRKRLLFGCSIAYVIIGCVSPYTHYYSIFNVIRAATGIFCAGIFSAIFNLLFESITSQFLVLACSLFFVPRVCAYFILCLFGWLLKNWKTLVLVVSTPAFFFIAIVVWLVPESPRWLIKRGQRADAARILRRMARLNGKDMVSTGSDIAIDSDVYSALEHTDQKLLHFFRDSKDNFFSFMWFMISWILLSYSYYTISYGSGFLSGNFMLSYALSGLVEVIPIIFAVVLQKLLQNAKKRIIIGSSTVTAILCFIGTAFTADSYTTLLLVLLIAKIGVTLVELLLFIVTVENFIGDLRTIIYLIMISFSSLGSIGAAYSSILFETKPFIPFVIVGLAMLTVAGVTFLLQDAALPLTPPPRDIPMKSMLPLHGENRTKPENSIDEEEVVIEENPSKTNSPLMKKERTKSETSSNSSVFVTPEPEEEESVIKRKPDEETNVVDPSNVVDC